MTEINWHNLLNTLTSSQAEMRDCYPTCCWCIMHIRLSAGLAHFLLQGYRQLHVGWLGLKLQTDQPWRPIFRTIRLQQRDHSFRYSPCFPSVVIMGFCRNVLQEDDILCELYVDIHSDTSDYSINESFSSDIDVPTTSSRKQLRASSGPLTPLFPRPFFLTPIKTIFITVWD